MDGDSINDGIEGLEEAGESMSTPTQSSGTTPTSASPFPDFLAKKTGSGEVEDYLDHPLNFRSSKGMGRIIRGFEGALGALDYWPVDVVIGTLQEVWEMVITGSSDGESPDG